MASTHRDERHLLLYGKGRSSSSSSSSSSENIIICLAEPFGILLIALLGRSYIECTLVTTCAMLVVNGQG